MKTATFKVTPNTKANREELRKSPPGHGYLVLYRDTETGATKAAVAKWNSEKFEYFGGRFIFTHCEPVFKPTLHRDLIMGWSRVVDWEE